MVLSGIIFEQIRNLCLVRQAHQFALFCLLGGLVVAGCQQAPLQHVSIGGTPTIPSALPGLIDAVESRQPHAIVDAAARLSTMGSEAAPAVPALACVLYDDEFPYRTREEVAYALGRMGSDARDAIPALIHVLEVDFVHARRAAALALGDIGDPSAVPAVANALYSEDFPPHGATIQAAVALARLTGEKFPDWNRTGYSIDQDGVPRIVKAAKMWWEEEGQYMTWPNVPATPPGEC